MIFKKLLLCVLVMVLTPFLGMFFAMPIFFGLVILGLDIYDSFIGVWVFYGAFGFLGLCAYIYMEIEEGKEASCRAEERRNLRSLRESLRAERKKGRIYGHFC